jgi:hypothetical protein
MKRLATIVLLALAPGTGLAMDSVPFGPSLAQSGWRTLTFRGLKPVDYRPASASRLDIVGDRAASLIWRELPESSWNSGAATWRWRVQSGPPATDLASKSKDDRAIALYFVFARDEAAARAAQGASSLTSAMWWSSGSALVYVFGGAGARGQIVSSQHIGPSGKLILRQPGGVYSGAWLAENANLASDFRRAFGRTPGPLVGIAVSSDSDDSGGLTMASLDDLRLK